jgi:predicted secreted protein
MSSTRTIRRITAASTAALITSVAVTSTATATTRTPVYTHKDTGRTVHLARGTVFAVKLRTCTDCGDSWHWKNRPNSHIVKQLSKRIVSHVKPPAVGGIATTVYRFKVVGTGTTRMVLVEKGPSGQRISHFRLTTAPPLRY